jgi:archaellum component FlaC
MSGHQGSSGMGTAGGKFDCGPGDSADEQEIKIYNFCDGGKSLDVDTQKIAECLSILGNTAKEILDFLKEQPRTEQVASMLCGAIQRAELALKSRCHDLDIIKTELCEVKDDVSRIKKSIDIPAGYIEEIKREINLIGKHMPDFKCFCPNVTSGSVIVEDQQATQVLVAVKNTTVIAQTVRVRVLRDDVCPAVVLADKCLLVSGCCSNAITVHFDNASAYQIEVFGLVPGMTVSSIELDICKRLIKCSRLTAAQFVCLEEKCP